MSDQPEETTLQRKLRERREARERAEREAAAQVVSFEEDLVPETEHERTESDIELDRLIDGIDIVDAYRRWCGKTNPKIYPGQTEGIKVSCPVPGHNDDHTSAWLNTETKLWTCAVCPGNGGKQAGGDVYDLAAIHFGIHDYKSGANFHRLREEIAKSYGYVVERLGESTVVVPPGGSFSTEPEPESDIEAEVEVEPEPGLASVTNIYADDEGDDDDPVLPSLDWRRICPEDSFLYHYMEACIREESIPEEYHFFNGLLAIGFALGRKATLWDSDPVYGNLLICTLGKSGAGKSRAARNLEKLLNQALPFDYAADYPSGVKYIKGSGSGEYIVGEFQREVKADPTNPKKVTGYAPIKGLIDYNELEQLVRKNTVKGSTLNTTVMQFYDMSPKVVAGSRTGGTLVAEQPFASLLTSSQPKRLKDLLKQSDSASGFLNRWLFVTGQSKPRLPLGGAIIDITSAIKPLEEIQAWASTSFGPGEHVEILEEVREYYWNWFTKNITPVLESHQDVFQRIDLTIKKLILLFAANRMEKEVSVRTIQDVEYCLDYLIKTYQVVSGAIVTLSETGEMAEDILRLCKKQTLRVGHSTKKTLWDAVKRKGYDKTKFGRVLDELVKDGEIVLDITNQKKIGRDGYKYRYPKA